MGWRTYDQPCIVPDLFLIAARDIEFADELYHDGSQQTFV